MKRFLALAIVAALAVPLFTSTRAEAAPPSSAVLSAVSSELQNVVPDEILVLTTPTLMTSKATATSYRSGLGVKNLGPNPIYCSRTTTPVVGKSWRVDANGGVLTIKASDVFVLYCIAESAPQVSGAATVLLEI